MMICHNCLHVSRDSKHVADSNVCFLPPNCNERTGLSYKILVQWDYVWYQTTCLQHANSANRALKSCVNLIIMPTHRVDTAPEDVCHVLCIR